MNSTHNPIINTHLSEAFAVLIKSVLVTILVAMTKYSRAEAREEGFILSQFEGTVSLGGEGMATAPRGGLSHCLCRQEAESGKFWCSAFFFLIVYIQWDTFAHGMVPLT